MGLEGPIILVVDDEPLVRLFAADTLSELGFLVLEAANADEAVALLEFWSDVRMVFADVRMPGSMDGIALASLIHERWPDIAVMLTSGHVDPAEDELPENARFLPKPYRVEDLVAMMEEICGVSSCNLPSEFEARRRDRGQSVGR
jgi:CheY-like chemotaxis protein